MQSSSQIDTTNKPTSRFIQAWMPFLLPNQQRQSSEGNSSKITVNDKLLTTFSVCLCVYDNGSNTCLSSVNAVNPAGNLPAADAGCCSMSSTDEDDADDADDDDDDGDEGRSCHCVSITCRYLTTSTGISRILPRKLQH